MGYSHISQQFATAINHFYTDALNPYLNFHGRRPPSRPCYFAVDTIDAKGKIRKTYPHDQIMTPWERLKATPAYENYLKPGITSQSLEHDANALSDNDAARHVQEARKRLFQWPWPRPPPLLTVDPNPPHDLNHFSLILRLENTYVERRRPKVIDCLDLGRSRYQWRYGKERGDEVISHYFFVGVTPESASCFARGRAWSARQYP